MQKIIKEKSNYETAPVNSIIQGNTIIPGIDGKMVDLHQSLIQMENFGAFNENYLVYSYQSPKVSLLDNMNKVIIKGNTLKNSVSIILEENSELENYLNNQKIKYTLLANLKTNLNNEREYLNSYLNYQDYSNLESLLNKNKYNKHICLINYNNYEYCLKKKYFLVSPTIETNSNIFETLNEIKSGSIILIKKSLPLTNLKLIIDEIKRQDLQIIYLSELINEKN